MGVDGKQVSANPESFGSEEEYAVFLRPRLRPRIRLIAIAGKYKGDSGPFLEADDSSTMPCKVFWKAHEVADWVKWRDVALEVGVRQSTEQHSARAQGVVAPSPPDAVYLFYC